MASVPTLQVTAGIRRLEGQVGAETPVFAPDSVFGGDLGLIRVDAMSRFWNNSALGFGTLESRHEKLLAGLCADAIPWAHIVLGDARGISVYLALPGGKDGIKTWGSTLSAAFPGCEASPGPSVGGLVGALAQLPCGAAMTGNSSFSMPRAGQAAEKPVPHATLESVFRAMQGGTWAYLVFGHPVSQGEIQQALAGLACEERELVSAHLRRGSAEENNNPQAKHYLDLLRAARKRYEAGSRQGMWNVHVVLLAAERDRLPSVAQDGHPRTASPVVRSARRAAPRQAFGRGHHGRLGHQGTRQGEWNPELPRSYAEQRALAHKVRDLCGDRPVDRAYFQGDDRELRTCLDRRLGEGSLDKLKDMADSAGQEAERAGDAAADRLDR